MNLDQISIKNFILALFKRDDGERILLGSGAYEFDADLQHFAANIIANDVIEKQGTDGQLLAGQVRRSAPQSFDGYVGDATTTREDTENYRRAFIRFFQPRHFYTVIYILPDGSATQRKNGYLTDAPAVPEQYQRMPRYHVALAFEDLNYYSYAEDAQGDETYAQTVSLQPESELTGGLVWESTPGLSLIRVGGDLSQTGTPTPTSRKAISVATGIQTITIDGASYTLDLGSNWLAKLNASQDYIYNDNGTWKIHKEIYRNTYDGTESWWSKNNNRTWRTSFSAPDIISSTIAGAAVCDRFVFWPNNGGAIGQNLPVDQFGFPAARSNIDFNCGDCPAVSKTIDEWKAWLAAHPVRIYSIRLSATETIITDTTLLAQLNAIDAALRTTTTAPTATTTSTDAIPAFLGTSNITTDDGIIWTAETAGGKNLAKTTSGNFVYSTIQTYALGDGEITSSRNTAVHQGGTFNMQTGATSQWTAGCVKDCHLTPDGGTYTITAIRDGSFTPRSGYTPRIAVYIVIYDSQGNETHNTVVETSTNATETLTLTLDPDKHIGCLNFYCQYCSFTDLKFKVQLEQGGDSTAYERFIPLGGAVWDAETGHATTTFTVNGLYAVNPIWTVPGPAESPLIENITNNTSLSYLGQIPAGQSLIIDCGNQTATIAGANVKNNVRGTWQTFEPGQITIRYSGANITGPSNLKWNEVVG